MTPTFVNTVLPTQTAVLDAMLRLNAATVRTFEDASQHIFKATRRSLETAVGTQRESLTSASFAASAALYERAVQDQAQTILDSSRGLAEAGTHFWHEMIEAMVPKENGAAGTERSQKKAA